MDNNIYLQILLATVSRKETNVKCVKCDSKNVTVKEFALRSQDEASTYFIKCKDCKHTEVTFD